MVITICQINLKLMCYQPPFNEEKKKLHRLTEIVMATRKCYCSESGEH